MDKVISVMVADTSEDFRLMLSEYINGEEDMVVAANVDNGAEAERAAAELRPDVLVTDLLLWEMDGFALLSRLSGRGLLPYTIVVSGFFSDSVAESAARLGVRRFLTKPCHMRVLIDCIRDSARSGREQPEAASGDAAFRRRARAEERIDEVLRCCEILPHLWGCVYLREALLRVWEDREKLMQGTKVLYPELAEHFSTTPASVERCIRNALDVAWRECDPAKRESHFGPEYASMLEKRPGNVRFMKIVVEYLEKQRRITDPG